MGVPLFAIDCAHLHSPYCCCLVSSGCWLWNRHPKGGEGERRVRLTDNYNYKVNGYSFILREESSTIFNSPKSANDRSDPQSYPFWMVIFCGIAVVVAALLHAAFWKPFSMIFGAIVSLHSMHCQEYCGYTLFVISFTQKKQTAFLSVLFISALGMILYSNGSTIRIANENDIDIPGWFSLEFAGALLALLFWVRIIILVFLQEW